MKGFMKMLAIALVLMLAAFPFGGNGAEANEDPTIYLKGNAKEIGQQYGKLAKEEIQQNIILFKQTAATIQLDMDYAETAAAYEEFLSKKNPQQIDQLKAMAESTDVSYDDLLAFNALGEDVLAEGCTTVLASGDATKSGNAFYHKNRDAMRGAAQVVVQVEPENGEKFIGITSAGYTGIAMGINESGVSVGNNVLDTWDRGPGYGNLDVIRLALENAEDAADAVAFIEEIQRSSGSNYGIADSDNAAFVEATHTATAVQWVEDDVMVHTNHYILDGMEQYEALDMDNLEDNDWSWYVSTEERLSRATDLMEQATGKIGAQTLIKLSEDQNGPDSTYWIDSQAEINGIPMGTVSTGTFDGSKERMWGQLGQPSVAPAIPFDVDRPHIPDPFLSGKQSDRLEETTADRN